MRIQGVGKKEGKMEGVVAVAVAAAAAAAAAVAVVAAAAAALLLQRDLAASVMSCVQGSV